MDIRSFAVLTLTSVLLMGCMPSTIKPSDQHIKESVKPVGQPLAILKTPPLPQSPEQSQHADVFTVVVNDVPVRELLFAIARDASVEIDIAEGVEGFVTLNAIDQTFDQIIERVSEQVAIRYAVQRGVVKVMPDSRFLKHYDVSYVNVARTSESTIAISTEVASTGSGDQVGNTSDTQIQNTSSHQFWQTITENINTILNEDERDQTALVDEALDGASTDEAGSSTEGDASAEESSSVLPSPESGVLSVFANQKQHNMIEAYLDLVLAGVKRQVFIEATIVEVELNDDYQAGVDWSRLVNGGDGFGFEQNLLGTNLATAPFTSLTFSDLGGSYNVNATVKLLNQFGNAKVLSTPKLMVLNNQTALLKVVDNRVYFTVNVESDTNDLGIVTRTFETEIHTVPVGLVMSVTPFVSPDNMITLNVRPTISRILQFVQDPNPELAASDIESLIPEISVREIESMLEVKNGDVAVIGGLMQDNREDSTDGVPVLSKLPVVNNLFSYKDNKVSKSELVIFLKPIVAKEPNLDGKFSQYKRFLNQQESSKK